MNSIILQRSDFISDGIAQLSDARFVHIQKILKAQVGDTLSIALLNEKMGTGKVTLIDQACVELLCDCAIEPPAKRNLTVVLALPRPKMLRRILKNCAELGVKELYLINSYKVEKSYWQTPHLSEASIASHLQEGLSQAKDCIMPTVHLKTLFKPFVEDELAAIAQGKEAFIAHPYQSQAAPTANDSARLIAIGPEGGFTDYEVNLLVAQGLAPIHLGPRIYRVENALTLLCNQLSL